MDDGWMNHLLLSTRSESPSSFSTGQGRNGWPQMPESTADPVATNSSKPPVRKVDKSFNSQSLRTEACGSPEDRRIQQKAGCASSMLKGIGVFNRSKSKFNRMTFRSTEMECFGSLRRTEFGASKLEDTTRRNPTRSRNSNEPKVLARKQPLEFYKIHREIPGWEPCAGWKGSSSPN